MEAKITTERLELKPIKLEDAEALFKITSNKTTTRYMLYAGTENIQETIDFITDCQKDWNRWYEDKSQPNVALNFSIFIKNTTTPIGTIEIDILEDPTTAEMGWMIHNDFQNKGYGSEAAFAMVDFAKKLGAKIENDIIVVNENMETNIKGLYACGDCTGGIYQISKAVYEGTKAGMMVIRDAPFRP